MATTFQSREIDDLLEGLTSFLDVEVFKRHQEAGPLLADPRQIYDPDGRFSALALQQIREVREASASAGYYTMFVPETLGGGGLGSEALFRVWEHIFHYCGPHNWLSLWAIAHWTRGPSHILSAASESVLAEVLPGLMNGSESMCFGMSEPDAGSDARRMQTRAKLDGDEWVLNGSKQWITNAPYAEHALVFAGTSEHDSPTGTDGYTAFMVPTDQQGLVIENNIRMFGHIGGDEGLLYLDDCRIGLDRVVGEVGKGFSIAMSGVSTGRLYNCGKSVGLGRWALEMGLDYANRRTAFGRPIGANQGVSFPLAESATELRAARLLSLDVARLLDEGTDARKELSMAKTYATEVATQAIDRVVQVHGAMGFTNELGLTEAWQATRKVCVADGTAEILRRQIARDLLSGNVDL